MRDKSLTEKAYPKPKFRGRRLDQYRTFVTTKSTKSSWFNFQTILSVDPEFCQACDQLYMINQDQIEFEDSLNTYVYSKLDFIER